VKNSVNSVVKKEGDCFVSASWRILAMTEYGIGTLRRKWDYFVSAGWRILAMTGHIMKLLKPNI
jgi:hypothetical protein